MTAQLPSKDTLQKIIETANEIITVNNGTNEDIWENDTATITRLYDHLNDDLANPSVVKALAEFALAAHEQEPVAWQDAVARFRELNEGFPVERFKADYVISWVLANYPRPAPVPAVPDVWTLQDAINFIEEVGALSERDAAYQAWNACRAAMLNGDKS